MRRFRSLLALAAVFAATAAAADTASSWPQTFTQNGNQLVVYQPQLDAWANRLAFTGRVAAVVTPAKGARRHRRAARHGADQHRCATAHRRAQRHPDHRRAVSRAAPPPTAAQATTLAKALLPKAGLSLSLDYLLAALVQAGQTATSVALATTPPTIFLAEQPSRLVQFDGAPTFATVAGTNVQHAINTNWTLLRTVGGDALYLLDSTGWLTSDTLTSGVWQYASQLPAAFSQLPDTKDWQDVRQSLIPAPADRRPTAAAGLRRDARRPSSSSWSASRSTRQVPGTGIYAVTNTDSLVFWDGYAKAFYYLVAGRWFRASGVGRRRGPMPPAICRRTSPRFPPTARWRPCWPRYRTRRRRARRRCRRRFPHLATVSRSTATRHRCLRRRRRSSRPSTARRWRTPSTRRAT